MNTLYIKVDWCSSINNYAYLSCGLQDLLFISLVFLHGDMPEFETLYKVAPKMIRCGNR